MSFQYNPFNHIELIRADDKNDGWIWYCHSCGADSARLSTPCITWDLTTLYANFRTHILTRHAMTEEDVKDWSDY